MGTGFCVEWTHVFIYLVCVPRDEMVERMLSLCLGICRTARPVSKVAAVLPVTSTDPVSPHPHQRLLVFPFILPVLCARVLKSGATLNSSSRVVTSSSESTIPFGCPLWFSIPNILFFISKVSSGILFHNSLFLFHGYDYLPLFP